MICVTHRAHNTWSRAICDQPKREQTFELKHEKDPRPRAVPATDSGEAPHALYAHTAYKLL